MAPMTLGVTSPDRKERLLVKAGNFIEAPAGSVSSQPDCHHHGGNAMIDDARSVPSPRTSLFCGACGPEAGRRPRWRSPDQLDAERLGITSNSAAVSG